MYFKSLSFIVPDKKVYIVLIAKRAKLNDFGRGYCWEMLEMRSIANICFWKSG